MNGTNTDNVPPPDDPAVTSLQTISLLKKKDSPANSSNPGVSVNSNNNSTFSNKNDEKISEIHRQVSVKSDTAKSLPTSESWNGFSKKNNDDSTGTEKYESTKSLTNGREEEGRPSTSYHLEEDELNPTWNRATRELYENNLKCWAGPSSNVCPSKYTARERASSLTDSNSSDDSCVYRYKGDQNVANGAKAEENGEDKSCSSPEMDYLEMDFDPCQSNGQESSDGSYSCEGLDLMYGENEAESNSNLNPNPGTECRTVDRSTSPNLPEPSPACDPPPVSEPLPPTQPTTSADQFKVEPSTSKEEMVVTLPKTNCSDIKVETAIAQNDSSYDEILCEGPFEQALIWSYSEANLRQYSEVTDLSSCYPSVINALNALEKVVNFDQIRNEITLNDTEMSLDETSSLTDFLFAASRRYLPAPSLISVIERCSGGLLTGKFFPTSTVKKFNLCTWLLYWIKKGAVPILSMKMDWEEGCQIGGWQYRMVHGVDTAGLYLTTPVQYVSLRIALQSLLRPGTLLVSKDEVVSRWSSTTDLRPLINTVDHAWKEFNVLGQVVNAIREDAVSRKGDDDVNYIKIPSSQKCGIILVITADSCNLNEMKEAPELPDNEGDG